MAKLWAMRWVFVAAGPIMKRLIPLLISTILCCASHLDYDLAFLEVVPDVRYQRPITTNYWNHKDLTGENLRLTTVKSMMN